VSPAAALTNATAVEHGVEMDVELDQDAFPDGETKWWFAKQRETKALKQIVTFFKADLR